MEFFDINEKYKISKCGQVFSIKSKRLIVLSKNGAGYLSVYIGLNQKKFVHRIMAEVFLGASGRFTVNHINGVKTDNRIENLEVFKSYREQVLHSRNVLRNRGKSITVDQVVEIIKSRSSGNRVKDIAATYGLTRHAVSGICTGRFWPSAGYPDIASARSVFPVKTKRRKPAAV